MCGRHWPFDRVHVLLSALMIHFICSKIPGITVIKLLEFDDPSVKFTGNEVEEHFNVLVI